MFLLSYITCTTVNMWNTLIYYPSRPIMHNSILSCISSSYYTQNMNLCHINFYPIHWNMKPICSAKDLLLDIINAKEECPHFSIPLFIIFFYIILGYYILPRYTSICVILPQCIGTSSSSTVLRHGILVWPLRNISDPHEVELLASPLSKLMHSIRRKCLCIVQPS